MTSLFVLLRIHTAPPSVSVRVLWSVAPYVTWSETNARAIQYTRYIQWTNTWKYLCDEPLHTAFHIFRPNTHSHARKQQTTFIGVLSAVLAFAVRRSNYIFFSLLQFPFGLFVYFYYSVGHTIMLCSMTYVALTLEWVVGHLRRQPVQSHKLANEQMCVRCCTVRHCRPIVVAVVVADAAATIRPILIDT